MAPRLLELANKIISADIAPYAKYGLHLGAMIDAFLHKQIDHFKSIYILVKAGQFQDAEIICRSSVEGFYLLLWSAHGPKDAPGEIRPLKWFAYEGIEGYHNVLKDHSYEVDFEYETAVFNIVNEYGYLFLTRKAKDQKRQNGSWQDDPFITGWPDKKIPDIVEELKDLGLLPHDVPYYEGYRGFSQWLHSSPMAFGYAFTYDDAHLMHNSNNCKFVGARAIVFGFESLAGTLQLFNNHFKLGFQDELAKFKSEINDLMKECYLSSKET